MPHVSETAPIPAHTPDDPPFCNAHTAFCCTSGIEGNPDIFPCGPAFSAKWSLFLDESLLFEVPCGPSLIGRENPLAIQPVFDPELMAEGCAFSFNITQNIEVFKT
jgi:hypothetical protein